MVDAIIIPASENQKKNFVDVMYGEKDFKQKFKKSLDTLEKEYTAKHKPFAYVLAKQDFDDAVRKIEMELQRQGKGLQGELKIDIGDLHKYGELSQFELLDTKPIDEMVIISGTKVPQRAYMRHEYRTKRGNYGVTVDMPWYAYQEKMKTDGKNTKT